MIRDENPTGMERAIMYAALAALIYIAVMLAWIGWDFAQSHPHGPFQFEVFGLFFLVLFGPGTFSLLASVVTYALKRSFPTILQVTALLSAIWVGYMRSALEGISI
ncbi:hypothetical protein [Ruegeria sp.]|uniref:hypothetical protein n=1 Tax=Ruegeria sp. TaxID=1879320 RepID=UPI003B5CC82F